MKNRNLILLLAAGAAYWYFFMYKKKEAIKIEQPGFTDQPGTSEVSQTQIQIQTEYSPNTQSNEIMEGETIVDQIISFNEPGRKLTYEPDGVFQTYYVNQVSGVKKMGVPFTI